MQVPDTADKAEATPLDFGGGVELPLKRTDRQRMPEPNQSNPKSRRQLVDQDLW